MVPFSLYFSKKPHFKFKMKPINRETASTPKRRTTVFGTGISKNLYSLYLRKYGKGDQRASFDE